MPSNYEKITEENTKKYGTDIGRFGPTLLANLYSNRTHFVYELLQNAEDAKASKVVFCLFKDRLEVHHNGRPFNEADVRGICGLVEGTKKEDLTQIGKFGIGFKSVYALTRTPKIYSKDEAFCVENYVHPYGIEKTNVKDNETLFVFPFDHEEVSPEEAFKDISERLRNLGSQTLLFLNNINEIDWNIDGIDGVESGSYIRDIKIQEGHLRRVFIVSQTGSQEDETDEEWLIFARPVKADDSTVSNLKVEVAFKIGIKGEKETIVPVPVCDSPLVVFFPTEKETHLKFLIQGPYRTTPSRDNIPKDNKWNNKLIHETALLIADTIPRIKALDFLTTSFLTVLPISRENFPEDHMFRPVFNAVLSKLKSDEELLPAEEGGYVSAKQAFLARGQDLISLLGTEQLSLLFEKRDCKWLDSNITQDKAPELKRYLTSELGIEEVDPEKFANKFTEGFIKEQGDEWIVKFYAFLKDHNALWDNYWHHSYRPYTRPGPIRNKPFIRLEDNSHVPPFDNSGKPRAYLSGGSGSLFPTVKKIIAEDNQAREFLKKLGLTEPDNIAEIIEFILPKYRKDNITVSDEENIKDVKTVAEAIETAPPNKKQTFIEELKELRFLIAVNAKTRQRCWCRPWRIYFTKLYTEVEDIEIYFEGNPDAYFLDEMYKCFKKEQLLQLGCFGEIQVENSEPYYIDEWGRHEEGLDGFNPHCEVIGLKHALESITPEKALIIWKTMKQYHKCIYGILKSSSRQDYVGATKKEMPSIMGKLVREREWLPDKKGDFHKPSDLLLSDLPDNFEKESLEARYVIEKLGIKKDIEQEYLSQIPEEKRKKIEFANTLTEDEIESIKEAREKIKEEHQEISDVSYTELIKSLSTTTKDHEHTPIPSPGPIPDPSGRRELTRKDINSEIDEPLQEARFKRIPVKKWERKNNHVRTFLREQYEGGKCQICGYTFVKKNGESYFEGLYLVSRTKASWIDRPGNVLCLCANCCAKFEHGHVEIDNILGQINEFKCTNEGGDGNAIINLKLCDEDVKLKFSERHMLDLQELIKADTQRRMEDKGTERE